MSAWGTVKNWFAGPSGADPSKVKLPGYEEDRDLIAGQMGKGNPYQQPSSYTGDWRNLIGQLQNGPSVAGMQYQRAVQDGQAGVAAMSRGSNRPGAMRAAYDQQANMTQGLAAGSAEASAQEMQGRQALLGNTINAASGAEAQVNSANQQAYMSLLASRLGLNAQQFQALLAKEQLKQQAAMAPTGFERAMKVTADMSSAAAEGAAKGAKGGA